MMKAAYFPIITSVTSVIVTLVILYLGQDFFKDACCSVARATRLNSSLINLPIIYRFVRHHRERVGETSFQIQLKMGK